MHARRYTGRRRGSPPRAKLLCCLGHRTPPCPDARSVREYRCVWHRHPTTGLHITLWNGHCVGSAIHQPNTMRQRLRNLRAFAVAMR